MSIVQHFERYFEILAARDETMRDAAYALRYQVYADELGWENPAAFPDQRERDRYDEWSDIALLRHRASGRVVACVRLIHCPPGERLPFERACLGHLDPVELDLAVLDRRQSGEISRLAIHHDFRRRRGEWASPEATGEPEVQSGGQRRYPLLPLSLFLAAAALAMNRGLQQVFVMMEPRLARLLQSCGIRFVQVGDIIDYHGQRGPFRITSEELADGLADDARDLLLRLRELLA